MNASSEARSSEPPDEPFLRSQVNLLSPASPKPLQFPQPTNIPILDKMMDIGFNQTEAHMNDPAMRNTELRPDAWRDPNEAHANDSANDSAAPPSTEDGAIDAPKQDGHAQHASIRSEGGNATSHSKSSELSNGFHHDEVAFEQPAPEDEPMPTAADGTPDQTNDTLPGQSQAPQGGPVDVQALLNTLQTSIAPSAEANVAPTAEAITVATTSSSEAQPPIPGTDSTSPLSASALAPLSATGLPPRPPPQIQPLINPNYAHSTRIGDYHPHGVKTHGRSSSSSNVEASPAGYATQQSPTSPHQPRNPPGSTPIQSSRELKLAAGQVPSTDEQPFPPDVQQKYDRFLVQEKKYVDEANWAQFPWGSRLFIGNLSSEKVTKRDLFYVFYKYGELAQISIKQAYGFVQFLTVKAALTAKEREEGTVIRDKKIHLEESRAQDKGGDKNRRSERRSRSPDYGRSRASNVDRYVSNGRDGMSGGGGRGRDGRDGGYRHSYGYHNRSPSPDGYRVRRDYPSRARSRSPEYERFRGHRSPRRNGEDDLPLPRRPARDVPEVQLLILDPLERDFVIWVEKAFKERGVRVDTLHVSKQLSEEAVVKRQIVEGVLAVSKLKIDNQNASQIGLTIFKRMPGSGEVNYEGYDNLVPSTAAQLVEREKESQRTQGRPPSSAGPYNVHQASYGAPPQQQYGFQQQPPMPPPGYLPVGYPPGYGQQQTPPVGYPPGYGQQQTPYGMPPQHPSGPPQSNRPDQKNLQSLLSTLNQASPTTPQTAGHPPQNFPPQGYPQQGFTPQAHPPQQQQRYGGQQGPYAATRTPQQQPPASAGAHQPGQAPGPNLDEFLARLGSYGKR